MNIFCFYFYECIQKLLLKKNFVISLEDTFQIRLGEVLVTRGKREVGPEDDVADMELTDRGMDAIPEM